jgi:hypothetical protein
MAAVAPGPHPENRKRRRELRGPRRGLIAVLVITAALAIASVSRAYPGTAMLLVLAGVHVLAAFALIIHEARARMIALVAALTAIAWGAWQVVAWNEVTWLQIGALGLGALEALFVAGCTPRDAGVRARSSSANALR